MTDSQVPARKSALVTGASGGIGRAVALALAAGGAAVTVNYPRPKGREAAEEVVAEIESRGGRAQTVEADITSIEALDRLVIRAAEFGGGLDIIVANAGGALALAPITEVTPESYDAGMALNARANFFLFQLAARHMRDNGRIIAISSSATVDAYPGTAVYAAAKASIEIFARVLARELGPRGITVNTVAPGLTDTPAMRAAVPQNRRELVIARTPLGRLGTPDDIADVVAFLASDAARWITGQNIRAGGGII